MPLSTTTTRKHKARVLLAFSFFAFLNLNLTGCNDSNFTDSLGRSKHASKYVHVIKVLDGDSVMLRGRNNVVYEARLFGIDAPEFNQPFGRQARLNLQRLILKKNLLSTIVATDRYGRKVVILKDKQRNINLHLVSSGNAWVYRQYQPNPDWIKQEKAARKAQKGLWSRPRPIAPWNWRKKSR